jgi:tRNA (guanine37-N1)-methyltransferase
LLRIDIITALPDIVTGPLRQSILQRASERGLVCIDVHDLREYADPSDPHRQIDDYPFGGGGGMVLKPEPIFRCVERLLARASDENRAYDDIIYMSPDGARFDQAAANRYSLASNLIILAGHYKGIDQRVRDELVTAEVSIGDYVLSGGELPALVLVDAVVRLIPGVLGDASSALSDSFQDGLLGAPVYTRPANFRGMNVPDVLLSGDHRRIRTWREEQREHKTKNQRPDLLERAVGNVTES